MANVQAPPKLRFIDADVHPTVARREDLMPYMSEGWRQRFEAQQFSVGRADTLPQRYAHPTGGIIRPDAIPPHGPAGSDPDFMRKTLLDQFNPEKVLLIPLQIAQFISWVDADAVGQVFSACNRFFAEHWLPKDDRFLYSILAVPHDPRLAAAEVRRAAADKRCAAIYIPLIDRLMGDRHYYPIYDAAVEVGLPIITHPTGQECSWKGVPDTAGGSPTSYIERYSNLPQIAQSNVSSLIFEGVFTRYPTLKVIFIEWGFSWLVGLQWRMDKAWRELRRETPWIDRLPSEIVAQHMRFTTQPIDEPDSADQFEEMLHMIRADQTLVFSTDYPHWDADVPNRVFRKQSEALRSKIFFENGAQIFSRAMSG